MSLHIIDYVSYDIVEIEAHFAFGVPPPLLLVCISIRIRFQSLFENVGSTRESQLFLIFFNLFIYFQLDHQVDI